MLPWVWGATEAEQAAEYACDRFIGEGVGLFRAVDAAARPETVYRWYCQLKVAPYSYDLIDNFGKVSPRTLTPGVDHLEIGQNFLGIFELVAFEYGRDLTLRTKGLGVRLFGDLAVSYTVRPAGNGSRLVAKLALPADHGPLAGVRRRLLAWGDLVMMRKQLRLLAALAERTETGAGV